MLGRNYYISCKMIEVATARIEKQSTGTTTAGINDIPQTTQYIVRRLFGEDVQQQVYVQRQQTTATQRDVAVTSRQSQPIADPYSLPISSKETTIRKGFEIQSDLMFIYYFFHHMYLNQHLFGANLSVCYRIKPKFSLGIGIGHYKGKYPIEKWNSFFFDIKYHFKETKFSPYVALEVGVDYYSFHYYDYYYNYYYYDYYYYDNYYEDSGFSIGIVSGFQYSFNKHFALNANLKLLTVTDYDQAYKIVIGVGVIYHF